MQIFQIHFPGIFFFGDGGLMDFIHYCLGLPDKKVYPIVDPRAERPQEHRTGTLGMDGVETIVNTGMEKEPAQSGLFLKEVGLNYYRLC